MQKYFDEESEYHFTTFNSFRDKHILTLPSVPEILLDKLDELREDFRLLIYGFVIMPNHIHLIWYVPASEGIAKVVKYFKGRTGGFLVPYLETKLKYDISQLTRPNGKRSFWKRGLHDFNLTSEKKFLEKLDYVHDNPVKWGLVGNPADWQYSSFRCWYDLADKKFKIDRLHT